MVFKVPFPFARTDRGLQNPLSFYDEARQKNRKISKHSRFRSIFESIKNALQESAKISSKVLKLSSELLHYLIPREPGQKPWKLRQKAYLIMKDSWSLSGISPGFWKRAYIDNVQFLSTVPARSHREFKTGLVENLPEIGHGSPIFYTKNHTKTQTSNFARHWKLFRITTKILKSI